MNRRDFLKGLLSTTVVIALAPLPPIVEVPVTETTRFVSFEEIARITLEKYRPILADAILSSPHSLFTIFKVSERIEIIEPIKYFNPVK